MSCNDHNCNDCGCDDASVERHLVQEPLRLFCTEVRGSDSVYDAERDDRFIVKYSGGEVILPCPDKLDCPDRISIVAADQDVRVSNTGQDQATNPGTNLPVGPAAFTVPAGRTATFFFVPPADDDCGACGWWNPDGPATPAA